jgi:hypothetical protein
MIVCFNFQAGQGNFQELVQQARTRPETQPGTRRDRHRARRSSQGKEGRRHQAARNWTSPCYWQVLESSVSEVQLSNKVILLNIFI